MAASYRHTPCKSGSPQGVFVCVHDEAVDPGCACVVFCCAPIVAMAVPTTAASASVRTGWRAFMVRPLRLLVLLSGRRVDDAEMAVHQLLDELDALVLEKLFPRLDAPVQRHADLPWAREHFRVLD